MYTGALWVTVADVFIGLPRSAGASPPAIWWRVIAENQEFGK